MTTKRMDYINKIEAFTKACGCTITYRNEETGILKIENQPDGIHNLILGVAPPVLIIEQFLFSFKTGSEEMYKLLLQKNRDMIHGAFVMNEEGNKILFRYTMQLENLDLNEFESALNSLGLLLSEYYEQIIKFSKM